MEKSMSPAHELVAILKARKLKISTAESISGGLLSSAITDVSGASAVFSYGVCTYSNEIKEKMFALMSVIDENKTAVCEAVAIGMARGAREFSGSDISLATTGLAGPDGDGINPVGTVFIAFAGDDKSVCKKFFFASQSRQEIKQRTVEAAIDMAIEYFKKEGKI